MSNIAGVAQAVPEHDKRTVLLRPNPSRVADNRDENAENAEVTKIVSRRVV